MKNKIILILAILTIMVVLGFILYLVYVIHTDIVEDEAFENGYISANNSVFLKEKINYEKNKR